jgi:hypothetical protein
MMLPRATAACRNRRSLSLKQRRSKPKADQGEHQAGKGAAHKSRNCTTSQSVVTLYWDKRQRRLLLFLSVFEVVCEPHTASTIETT